MIVQSGTGAGWSLLFRSGRDSILPSPDVFLGWPGASPRVDRTSAKLAHKVLSGLASFPGPLFWPVLLVAGILLRVFFLFHFGALSSPELWEFGIIAENLVKTGVFSYRVPGVPSAYMPPAYPLILAGCYGVLGKGLAAHMVVALLLLAAAAAIPLAIGALARSVGSERAGALAFALALFWPQLLIMSGRLHPISLYTLLLILACNTALAREWSVRRRAVVAGILLGLFGLFRFETPLIAAVFGLQLLRTTDSSARAWSCRRWRDALILAGVAALAVSPWVIRNAVSMGRATLGSSAGLNMLRGHHDKASGTGRDAGAPVGVDPDEGTPLPDDPVLRAVDFTRPAGELLFDDRCSELALEHILKNAPHEVQLAINKLWYFFVADFTHRTQRIPAIWIPSLVALLVGLAFFLVRWRNEASGQFLWLLFLTQLFLVLLTFVLPRYRMLVDFVPLVFLSRAADLIRNKTSVELQRRELSQSRAQPQYPAHCGWRRG